MRGFVCANLGVLPNDPLVRTLSDSELVFIHYYLRKKQVDDRLFMLGEGAKVIGRALGTYWTYESANQAVGKGGDGCTACGCTDKTISHETGVPIMVCVKCLEPWDVNKLHAPKPSEINVPLAVMLAYAMKSKNTGDVLKFVQKNLGPKYDIEDHVGGAPSEVVTGAKMMDSAHSNRETFIALVKKAMEEAHAPPPPQADAALAKADAMSGSVGVDQADYKGDDSDKEPTK